MSPKGVGAWLMREPPKGLMVGYLRQERATRNLDKELKKKNIVVVVAKFSQN